MMGLLVLARRLPWLAPERARTRLVAVAGVGYAALVAITVWQALRGQSVVHPDAPTGWALAATALVVVLGAAWALRRSPQPATEPAVA